MWETVMGLEIHVELATDSKIFCSCPTTFGGEPNTHCCPVCTGMPGTLPVLNSKVLEYAVAVGLALNCEISEYTRFDRKNYFYPDLPKAYQISQLYYPFARNGFVELNIEGNVRRIGIHEIHMEEDAGKLIHSATENETYPDYNRCGVPLLEIVSEPDLRTAAEVIAYLEKLKSTFEYLGVSDCKMQEGSMRVDVNISVRLKGEKTLGTRTEMKNLNSFKAIEHVIENEAARQEALLSKGHKVIQETRRWDDDKRESYGMRSKENAQDYRYFPEPDIPPILIDKEYISSVRASLPEFASEKQSRYINDYGLNEYDAGLLTADKYFAALFEKTVALTSEPKKTANWMIVHLMKIVNERGMALKDIKINPEQFSELIVRAAKGSITGKTATDILELIFDGGEGFSISEYISSHDLEITENNDELEKAVTAVFEENKQTVEEYLSGKTKVLGFLVGKIMKELKGKANPAKVKEVTENELNKLSNMKGNNSNA